MNETANSCSLDQSFPLMECRVILDDILSECGTEKFQTASVPSDKPHKSHCCHTDDKRMNDKRMNDKRNFFEEEEEEEEKYSNEQHGKQKQ